VERVNEIAVRSHPELSRSGATRRRFPQHCQHREEIRINTIGSWDNYAKNPLKKC
jgi:hypothetical protein